MMKIRKGQCKGCRWIDFWNSLTCVKRILVFVLIFFLAFPAAVFAGGDEEALGKYDTDAVGNTNSGTAKRWVNRNSEEYKAIYGESTSGKGDKSEVNVFEGEIEEPDLLGGLLGSMLGGIANGLYDILRGDNIDLTIDGIVYGRLANAPVRLTKDDAGEWEPAGYKMNLMHFGLEPNNAWGLFGASLYFVLRDRFALIIIPVIGLIAIGKEAFRGGEKGRAGIKTVIKKLVGFFVIMYAVPYLLEAYIYIRDVAIVVVRDGLSVMLEQVTGDVYVGTGDIYYSLRKSWEELGKPLLLGLILIGYAAAGLVYFWDYIKIALLIAATFGMFPVVLIWWFFKPKILTDWLNIVLPALLTPFVDMVLLLAPCFLTGMFSKAFTTGKASVGTSVVLSMAVLACIWVMRIVRDRIIKLFGFEGIRGGNAGLGMALAMLMRGGMKGRDDVSESPRKPNVDESIRGAERSAEEMKSMNEIMENADSTIDTINSSERDPFSAGEGGATDEMLREMGEEDSGYYGSDEESEYNGGGAYDNEEYVGMDVDDEEGRGRIDETEPVGEVDYVEAGFEETNGDGTYGEEVGRDVPGRDMGNEGEPSEREDRNIRGGESGGTDDETRTRNDGTSGEENDESRGIERGLNDADIVDVDRLHFEPMSKEQREFAAGMSDRDKNRFSNLRHIDALEDRIARNDKIMQESGYNRKAYEKAVNKRSELTQQMKDLKMEEEQIASRKTALDKDLADGVIKEKDHSKRMDILTKESNENERRIQSTANALKSNSEYITSMAGARRADVANINCSRELNERKDVESRYAYNSGLGGMNNRSYRNADDFLYQKRVDDVKKQHISYSNFDSKQYDGILSPAEREQLYRERSERMAIERAQDAIINASAKTLGVATGAITAAAFTFAGPGAMAGAHTTVSGAVSGAVGRTGTPGEDENDYPFRRETPTVAPDRRNAPEAEPRRTTSGRMSSSETVVRHESGGRSVVEREVGRRNGAFSERVNDAEPIDNSRRNQEVRNNQSRVQQSIIEREISSRDDSAMAHTEIGRQRDVNLDDALSKAERQRDSARNRKKDE